MGEAARRKEENNKATAIEWARDLLHLALAYKVLRDDGTPIKPPQLPTCQQMEVIIAKAEAFLKDSAPFKLDDSMPVCPYCRKELQISVRPMAIGTHRALIVSCANPMCRRVLPVSIVGSFVKPEQPRPSLIIDPSQVMR